MEDSKLVPLVGRIPFPAYRGTEPYAFVSYAHADAGIVFPIIRQFNDQGYHLWYDEGITPESKWTNEIASALENDDMSFLAFRLKSTTLSAASSCASAPNRRYSNTALTYEEFLHEHGFTYYLESNKGLYFDDEYLAFANKAWDILDDSDFAGISHTLAEADRCDVAVVMGDARHAETLAHATFVTKPVLEDGLAHALRHFGLIG